MNVDTALFDLDRLDFTKAGGTIAVVTQDARSGVVLMMAYADREALERTLATGEMHYRSRTRGLWHKGATSGHVQRVVSLSADCDGDAVLARVIPAGPGCHTGMTSCFGEAALDADALGALARRVERRVESRVSAADTQETTKPSYTRRLLGDRNLRLKKIGEEGAELVTALADSNAARATEEAADLIYHMMVALRSVGATLGDVREVLALRADPTPK
jgi:phosphoribosyl-AMP cyclohydrolase / phosphoribosyl-ATP pyrophosphohydrolase